MVNNCRVGGGHARNWIPDRLFFAYSATAHRVEVVNPRVMRLVGHPIAGKVRTDDEGRTVFQWALRERDTRGRTVEVAYDATIGHEGRTLNVHDLIGDIADLDEAHAGCTLK